MRGKKNEKETNQTLLKCVEKIALEAKSFKICKDFLLNNKMEIQRLSDFFEISEIQAVLFCVIFTINFGSCTVVLENIAEYINCSPVSVVNYLPELDNMVEKKCFGGRLKTAVEGAAVVEI